MKDICRVLEVSVSGYYRWVKRKNMPTRDELLSAAIKDVLDEDPWNDNYGVRRMQLALAQRGIRAGIRRLTRLMRENGWLHERKRRPKGLTKADPEAMKAENLINQDFSAEKPYQKLLTDITQVQCADGKLYISPILDCFNGEIVSLVCDNFSLTNSTAFFYFFSLTSIVTLQLRVHLALQYDAFLCGSVEPEAAHKGCRDREQKHDQGSREAPGADVLEYIPKM